MGRNRFRSSSKRVMSFIWPYLHHRSLLLFVFIALLSASEVIVGPYFVSDLFAEIAQYLNQDYCRPSVLRALCKYLLIYSVMQCLSLLHQYVIVCMYPKIKMLIKQDLFIALIQLRQDPSVSDTGMQSELEQRQVSDAVSAIMQCIQVPYEWLLPQMFSILYGLLAFSMFMSISTGILCAIWLCMYLSVSYFISISYGNKHKHLYQYHVYTMGQVAEDLNIVREATCHKHIEVIKQTWLALFFHDCRQDYALRKIKLFGLLGQRVFIIFFFFLLVAQLTAEVHNSPDQLHRIFFAFGLMFQWIGYVQGFAQSLLSFIQSAALADQALLFYWINQRK